MSEKALIEKFVTVVAPDLVPAGGFKDDESAMRGLYGVLKHPRPNQMAKKLVAEALQHLRGRHYEEGLGLLVQAVGGSVTLPEPPKPADLLSEDEWEKRKASTSSLSPPPPIAPALVEPSAAGVPGAPAAPSPSSTGLFPSVAAWMAEVATAGLPWAKGQEPDRTIILAALSQMAAGVGVLAPDDVRMFARVLCGMLLGGQLSAAGAMVSAALEDLRAKLVPSQPSEVPSDQPLTAAIESSNMPTA